MADTPAASPTRRKTSTSKAAAPAAEAASTEAAVAAPKKKKKARRYSKELKQLQKVERALTEAGVGHSDAVSKGLAEWRRRSRKSARKKKDGAIKDAFRNGAYASGEFLGRLADVPAEVLDEVDLDLVVSPKKLAKALPMPFDGKLLPFM